MKVSQVWGRGREGGWEREREREREEREREGGEREREREREREFITNIHHMQICALVFKSLLVE